jgi:hypothetical protein
MSQEITIPSEEEIKQLPRWAIVAYAARCARRVEPLFVFFWPGSSNRTYRSHSQGDCDNRKRHWRSQTEQTTSAT